MIRYEWRQVGTSKWVAQDGKLEIAQEMSGCWIPLVNGHRVDSEVYRNRAKAMEVAEVHFRRQIVGKAPPAPEPPSKYHRKLNGRWIDVYDILHVYDVKCPATQHAIKKLLMPGARGANDAVTDLTEAKLAISRAIELKQTDG